MFMVSLQDDWDRTVAEWQVETEKEGEELKKYIENKIKELDLECYYCDCEVYEPGYGTMEAVDEYFKDTLEDMRKEAEERKERDKNYVSPLNGVIDKFDTTKVPDFSGMFKDCK